MGGKKAGKPEWLRLIRVAAEKQMRFFAKLPQDLENGLFSTHGRTTYASSTGKNYSPSSIAKPNTFEHFRTLFEKVGRCLGCPSLFSPGSVTWSGLTRCLNSAFLSANDHWTSSPASRSMAAASGSGMNTRTDRSDLSN